MLGKKGCFRSWFSLQASRLLKSCLWLDAQWQGGLVDIVSVKPVQAAALCSFPSLLQFQLIPLDLISRNCAVCFYSGLPPVSYQLVHPCISDGGASDLAGLPHSLLHHLQLLKCSRWLTEAEQGHFSFKFQSILWKAFRDHEDCPETAPHGGKRC